MKADLTLSQMIDLVDFYFISISRFEPLSLIGKALSKARVDKDFASRFENAILHGSTVDARKVFTEFGPYVGENHLPPELRIGNQIDAIDAALFNIHQDILDGIEFYNFMHNQDRQITVVV